MPKIWTIMYAVTELHQHIINFFYPNRLAHLGLLRWGEAEDGGRRGRGGKQYIRNFHIKQKDMVDIVDSKSIWLIINSQLPSLNCYQLL
jgi:hypothetical protein